MKKLIDIMTTNGWTPSEQSNYINQMLNGTSDEEAMANIEADRIYQEKWDELWEAGRYIALDDMIWGLEYPEHWTDEDLDDVQDEYEIVDIDPDPDSNTCTISIGSDSFEAVALYDGNTEEWKYTHVEFLK